VPGPAIFVRRGHGPDVVLVHGALGDYRQWNPIGDRLEPGYRVFLVSRRFHYPNEPPFPNEVYTYELHRDDLLKSMRSWPLPEPAHLVGHSWGAGVTLLTALKEPSAVRSLTLIEPALGSVVSPATPGFEPEAASRGEMVAAVQTFVRARQDDRAAEVLFDWLQGGTGGFAALAGPVKDGLLTNVATIGPTFAFAPPAVTCDQLQALRVPTLVLNGALTRNWFRLIGEAFKACIPGAEAGIIPGARHMTIVENPEATADLVIDFLSRH
jgi:pimeloyl-ACP methyl ester carboxylesterase